LAKKIVMMIGRNFMTIGQTETVELEEKQNLGDFELRIK